MNFNEKLKLYFFNPEKEEEEYHAEYKKLTDDNIVAYSPLYLLRRQMLFLSGIITGIRKDIYHKTYLSAIIISSIVITGLVELIFDKEKITQEEYKQFYEKYFGVNVAQMIGLRILRNGLEHNNFQLYSRVYKNNKYGTKKQFDEMINYLSLQVEWNGIWRPDKESIDFFKITFALSENKKWQIVSKPSIQDYNKASGYLLIQYQINPFKYIEHLEFVINNISKEISSNRKLFRQFDQAITMDNWMKFYGT